MVFCPECRIEYEDEITECPVCSRKLISGDADSDWVMLGAIEDKISADFAKEVLSSYDIPSVVISKSGFFGQAGLTFNTFCKSGSSLFEVSVPSEHVREAVEILDMALGDSWQKKE